MPFLRWIAGYLKPTTEAAQGFGPVARKNVFALREEEMGLLCRRGEMAWRTDAAEEGYVFLSVDGWVWGCGLYLKPDRLLCRLPRALKNRWAAMPLP